MIKQTVKFLKGLHLSACEINFGLVRFFWDEKVRKKEGGIKAGGDLTVGGDITVGEGISVSGNIEAGGDVRAGKSINVGKE